MIEIYGYSIAVLPVIAAVVYGVIELLKWIWFERDEGKKKYIPIIAGALGAVLGVVLFFITPEAMPVDTWYASILVGLASGLSAVGVNQIIKQAERKDGEDAGTR